MAAAPAAALLPPRTILRRALPPISPSPSLWRPVPALSAAAPGNPSRSGDLPMRETDALVQPRAPTRPIQEQWTVQPVSRRWREREAEILRDVNPIIALVKHVLHSDRYKDGECLSPEHEKAVLEKLLVYHPRFEDKIGCGLDAIMVDRHPEFEISRCLFVVRSDGKWIDFSYQKCLRSYLRRKYPFDAERFIKEHLKRT